MLSLSRKAGSTDRSRRSRGAFVASLALNAIAIGLFFRAVTEGYRWSEMFRPTAHPAPVERIGFVRLPKTAGPPVAGRNGGDGRPVTTRRAPAPVPQAPSTVPDAIAPAPTTAAPPDQGGSGKVVGTGGATEGIEPRLSDPRLWIPAGPNRIAPTTPKERIDSVIADGFGRARDSMIAERDAQAGQRKPGDWTVKGPGGKWGMDPSQIHLGKISIPTAILALLSQNVQQNLRGNPIQMSEDRRLASVRADLLQHAQTEQNADLFRSAVKEIRARKDRERAARLAAQKAAGDQNP